MKQFLLSVFASVLAAFGMSAFAASAYDITGVTTALTDVGGQILLVGAAVLLVFVAIKAYKWIRRAL
jgi:hypothetical protein